MNVCNDTLSGWESTEPNYGFFVPPCVYVPVHIGGKTKVKCVEGGIAMIQWPHFLGPELGSFKRGTLRFETNSLTSDWEEGCRQDEYNALAW